MTTNTQQELKRTGSALTVNDYYSYDNYDSYDYYNSSEEDDYYYSQYCDGDVKSND